MFKQNIIFLFIFTIFFSGNFIFAGAECTEEIIADENKWCYLFNVCFAFKVNDVICVDRYGECDDVKLKCKGDLQCFYGTCATPYSIEQYHIWFS